MKVSSCHVSAKTFPVTSLCHRVQEPYTIWPLHLSVLVPSFPSACPFHASHTCDSWTRHISRSLLRVFAWTLPLSTMFSFLLSTWQIPSPPSCLHSHITFLTKTTLTILFKIATLPSWPITGTHHFPSLSSLSLCSTYQPLRIPFNLLTVFMDPPSPNQIKEIFICFSH